MTEWVLLLNSRVIKNKEINLIVGYARVSTNEQNLGAQVELLRLAGVEKLFEENASGTNRHQRPELSAALEFTREGDSFVITRLDRLARSMTDLGQIAATLENKKVDLVVTEQSIDTSSATGRLMFHMIGAFAEFETELRKERQMEGIKRAKVAGKFKGRQPTIVVNDVTEAMQRLKSPALVAKELGISRASVYRLQK